MQGRINRTARPVLPALLPAIACAAMLAAPCALAMNKCIDENGHTIYTDQSCPQGSKKKDVSDKLKASEKSFDPAGVVAQSDAAIDALDYEKFRSFNAKSTRDKMDAEIKKKGAGAKDIAATMGLMKALQPTNIKLVEMKYTSGTEAIVRQEGGSPWEADGVKAGPMAGTTWLTKEEGGWKIERSEWKPK